MAAILGVSLSRPTVPGSSNRCRSRFRRSSRFSRRSPRCRRPPGTRWWARRPPPSSSGGGSRRWRRAGARRRPGWQPRHLTLWRGHRLVAAAPAYRKERQQRRVRLRLRLGDGVGTRRRPYYPKLVLAAPLTPSTGRRFLVAPGEDRRPPRRARPRRAGAAPGRSGCPAFTCSSPPRRRPSRSSRWASRSAGRPVPLAQRAGTARPTTSPPLQLQEAQPAQRERRARPSRGSPSAPCAGDALAEADPGNLPPARQHRRQVHVGPPLAEPRASSTGCSSASDTGWSSVRGAPEDRVVAGAFNLASDRVLYGRYWGCFEEHPFLHFNVCLYHPDRRVHRARGLVRSSPAPAASTSWSVASSPASPTAHTLSSTAAGPGGAALPGHERAAIQAGLPGVAGGRQGSSDEKAEGRCPSAMRNRTTASVVTETQERGEAQAAAALQGAVPQRQLHDDGVRGGGAREVFHKSESDAVRSCCTCIRTGIGVAGVYTYEVAETKIRHDARQLAKEHEFPLKLTMEPEEALNRGIADHRQGAAGHRSASRSPRRSGMRHEYLTLEHLLLGLLERPAHLEVLKACGANVERLQAAAGDASSTRRSSGCPKASNASRSRPRRRAGAAARRHPRAVAEQKVIDGGDVLVAHLPRARVAGAVPPASRRASPGSTSSTSSPTASRKEAARTAKRGARATAPAGATTTTRAAPARRTRSRPTPPTSTPRRREGRIDPLIGREHELERTIQVLCRRRKNNPLYVGEPGVGKTAIAEGLALRIHEEQGARRRSRTRRSTRSTWARCSPAPSSAASSRSGSRACSRRCRSTDDAILFIDEIHTIVGAGATSGGSMDASNLLKPALASGQAALHRLDHVPGVQGVASSATARWRGASRRSRSASPRSTRRCRSCRGSAPRTRSTTT